MMLLLHRVYILQKMQSCYNPSDSEASDDYEFESSVQTARTLPIPFGPYRGKPMSALLKTHKRRDYLRRLLKWDGLNSDTRHHLQMVMDDFEEREKTRAKAPAKTRPKTAECKR